MSGVINLPINSLDANVPSNGRIVVYAKSDGLYLRRETDSIGIRLRLGMDDTAAAALKNNGATDMQYGEVVIWDMTADEAVVKTTIDGDYRVAGVVNSAQIISGNIGSVMTTAGQIIDVLCDSGAVKRGQFLIASSTSGRARAAGYYRTENTFAVALSEKAAGSEGLVHAMLVHSQRTAIAGNAGWAVGGDTGTGSPTTNTQRLLFANETWASVASAALPTALFQQAGLGYSVYAGYAIGGYTGAANVATAYKVTFAIDGIATVAGAALGTARRNLRYGHNASTRGWIVGGYTTAAVATTDKIDFLTDLRSAGGNLTVADYYRSGTSDGTQIFTVGSTSQPANRIVIATEVFSAATDANLTLAVYAGVSFPVLAGYYFAGTSGAKIVFATGVAGACSGPAGTHNYASGVGDGLSVGFLAGNNASPYGTCERFNPATETFSGSASMGIGKFSSAVFNNGAF